MPLISIVISILGTGASIYYTYTSQYEQNRRWNAESISTVSWRRAYFFAWKIIPKEDAVRHKWDSRELVLADIEKEALSGVLRRITEVVPLDIRTQKNLFLLQFLLHLSFQAFS